MSFSPERCPLCGQPNDCQLATQADCKGPCWCMKENFPPDLLARVPEEARRCACICQRCLADARSGTDVPSVGVGQASRLSESQAGGTPAPR